MSGCPCGRRDPVFNRMYLVFERVWYRCFTRRRLLCLCMDDVSVQAGETPLNRDYRLVLNMAPRTVGAFWDMRYRESALEVYHVCCEHSAASFQLAVSVQGHPLIN